MPAGICDEIHSDSAMDSVEVQSEVFRTEAGIDKARSNLRHGWNVLNEPMLNLSHDSKGHETTQRLLLGRLLVLIASARLLFGSVSLRLLARLRYPVDNLLFLLLHLCLHLL